MRRFTFSKKKISIIVSLLLLLSAALYETLQPQRQETLPIPQVSPTISATSSAQLVVVKRVIDGDTIEVENGQKVRYIGVDTPELHDPRKPVQCFAQEAMLKNKELVEGKTVRLEKDMSEVDRYKRLLRYVYSDNPTASPSSLFINEYLVREGYAYAVTFPPDVKYSDHFRELENQARLNNKGLWQKCQ